MAAAATAALEAAFEIRVYCSPRLAPTLFETAASPAAISARPLPNLVTPLATASADDHAVHPSGRGHGHAAGQHQRCACHGLRCAGGRLLALHMLDCDDAWNALACRLAWRNTCSFICVPSSLPQTLPCPAVLDCISVIIWVILCEQTSSFVIAGVGLCAAAAGTCWLCGAACPTRHLRRNLLYLMTLVESSRSCSAQGSSLWQLCPMLYRLPSHSLQTTW